MSRKLTGDRCQCSGPPYGGCGEYFNSTGAFDRHRVGPFTHDVKTRRCLTPDEMRAKGMTVNAAGFWIKGQPMTPEEKARSRKRSLRHAGVCGAESKTAPCASPADAPVLEACAEAE